MKKEYLNSLLKLHAVVFIYGFTAILGKLISISAIDLVWYRMLIATVSLGGLFAVQKYSLRISVYDAAKILLIGVIVAAHWITFFGAVKLSNVSVTLGCLASSTLFTSILEPLLVKRRIVLLEVFIGILIILGLYLIFRFETNYTQGIIVALTSAFLAALFTVLNKIMVQHHSTRTLTFYEMLGGFIGISLYFAFTDSFSSEFFQLQTSDLSYLLLLGIVCTAFAFAIQVDVMRKLSAYVVALSINLEPVYGILMAFLFFGSTEFMSVGFYIGTIIILISVFGYPILKTRKQFRSSGK